MELIDNILMGFGFVLTPQNLFYCFLGVFMGTFLGALPGIGSLASVSMLLPLSIGLPPTTALVLLAGVYYGSEYGGSTSSILLNLPGTPTNAVTCLDGYPMAQQGRAGVALFTTTIASFFGGSVGIIALYTLSPLLADAAIAIGPAEYFSLMMAGLVAAAVVSDEKPLKGIAMVGLGLLLGTVGSDVDSGVARYNLGFLELRDGISFIALAMGLFGVSEVILSLRTTMTKSRKIGRVTFRSMLPEKDEWLRSVKPAIRGSAIGSFFGALPGTGGTIATFMGYALEKKLAKDPSRFGKGAIEGIVSPETANNAAAQTAFIPTLTLGIPGSATMAIMLGALVMNGVAPGPQLITNNPEIFWGLAASFWIGNVLLLVLNIPLIGIWIRLLQIPYGLLYPAILVLICIGTYTVRNSVFDIVLVLMFGLAGYGLRMLRFQLAPILIGFILGPMIEANFKRAMLFSRGDFVTFFERPVSGITLTLTLLMLGWAVFKSLRKKRPLVAAGPD